MIPAYIAPDSLSNTQGVVFGKPLKESLKYASVQISTANADGVLYVWGYIPVVVAKWCVLSPVSHPVSIYPGAGFGSIHPEPCGDPVANIWSCASSGLYLKEKGAVQVLLKALRY